MPDAFPRRLAAIMFTDMVGYSALTQRSESLALDLLDEHNQLIRAQLTAFAGREIKTVGDAFLVEFDSALAAVNCAIAVQRAFAARNAPVGDTGTPAPTEPIRVRIGIHLGDVVYRENDVFGDGVNIAARVQSSADSDEIRVSEDVARQVQNKVNLPLHDLGPTQLKNINEPVRIYSITLDGRTARVYTERAANSTETPAASIAVLAFVNRSASAEDEYFSDGLADELMGLLAKIEGLRVAARTSAFYFKGKSATVAEIGKTLNVATVLDGSVRKSGNRARISVQLVRVDNGFQMWGESYDRTLDDIFAVQDDIAQSVVGELRQRLLHRPDTPSAAEAVTEDVAAAARGRSENTEAHILFLQARFLLNRQGEADIVQAVDFLRQAVARDANFAQAWALLSTALTMVVDFALGPVADTTAESLCAAERALSLEPNLVEGHIALCAHRTMLQQDWYGALASAQRALNIAPHNPAALAEAAHIHLVLRRLDEALQYAREAVARDPLNSDCYRTLSMVLSALDQLVECELVLRRALDLSPQSPALRAQLALVMHRQGKNDAALVELEREPTDWARLRAHSMIQFHLGRREASDRALEEMIARYGDGAGFSVANIHAYRGEIDLAFEWLDRAIEQRDSGLAYALGNFQLRLLHSDSRWPQFLKKAGFLREV